MTLEALHRRARLARSRSLMRQREYRERDLASGVWVKLRHELALTERAFAVDEAAAVELERAGHVVLAAGRQLSPPIRAYVLAASALEGVRLGAEVALRIESLARVPAVVLVRFDVALR